MRSVNIDGENYLIKRCKDCPFHDYDDDTREGPFYLCNHPKFNGTPTYPSQLVKKFIKDCPLGLVKDCFSCKYEERRKKDKWCDPCCRCTVTYHTDTHMNDPPSKWEMKE